MWVRILGSAAGGGFPQWNCNCANCRGVRSGALPGRPRTQSSIAVSADRRRWFLFNASPDIRAQIEAFPALWPHGTVRNTPVQAVVLSDAEIDHTLGLLILREQRALRIYATAWVHRALMEWNPILRTLGSYCALDWQPVRLHEQMPLCGLDGLASGLQVQAFSTLSAKTVAYAATSVADPETTVGYRISDIRTGRALVYMPAVQELNSAVRAQLRDCACVLFDGTCWEDDELVRLGISQKTARAMGHLPIGGQDGSLEQLSALPRRRIIYIHINNTNPILIEGSPQRQAVESHGLEIAADDMEMEI